MSDEAHLLAFSAALAWVMVMTAASLKTRWWEFRGLRLALSNRDALPEPSPLTARADRAARNMLENLVLFVALVAAARLAGLTSAQVTPGATVFFWARLLYFPVYLAGITVLRTALWAAGVIGMGMIFARML
jgi:uncharacterized MAPEG superfamily protein